MPTKFQEYVNKELPKRIATNDAAVDMEAGKVFVTTGVGLLTEAQSYSAGGGYIYESEVFTLDDTDISNMYVLLSYTPNDTESIEFNVRHAPTQFHGVDYAQDATYQKRITWEGYNLEDTLQVGDQVVVNYLRSL